MTRRARQLMVLLLCLLAAQFVLGTLKVTAALGEQTVDPAVIRRLSAISVAEITGSA